MAIEQRIAMLIDAENIESSAIETIIKKLTIHGRITTKRIYSDWTQPRNNSWKSILNSYAIRPIQKFAYTSGKGSSDSALIIDAMDILYKKDIDVFCIVSSDSDYTGLAHRIREDGLLVIGAGKSHTPKAFIASCDDFIFIDESKSVQAVCSKEKEWIDLDYDLINKAFDNTSKSSDELVLQSRFSESLKKLNPKFSIKEYGYTKFNLFCQHLKGYEVVKHKDNTTFSLKRST